MDEGTKARSWDDETAELGLLTDKGRAMRRRVMTGLLLGVMLASLDQTVVGTSLPRVVADIGGLERFAWVFSAYVLAVTVVIPLAGKLSDLYGRRPVYLLAMIVFLVGSGLCGLAQDMTHLIVFRAVQGAGGGMLFPVAAATVADLYSPAERGKLQGALAAVFGFASVIGPFVGGYIVDYVHVFGIASWRWVFYVNIPLGVVAIAAVAAFFPKMARKEAPVIDYAGSVLMTLSLVSLVLITIWGGETYPWASVPILGLAALAVVSFVLFVFVERRAKEPVIPLALFRVRIFALSASSMALVAFGMFAVVSFLPTYLQGVVGMTAMYSGAILVPLTLTVMIAAGIGGAVVNRVGYKPLILGGAFVSLTGLAALTLLGTRPAVWQALLLMMYIGIGFGLMMPMFIIAVQNVVDKKLMGVATSTLTLMRSLGATVGVTILGTVLNARLRDEMAAHVPGPVLTTLLGLPGIDGQAENIPLLLLQPAFVGSMPAAVVDGIKVAFSQSLSTLFLVAAVMAVVVLVIASFIESRPLKGAAEYHGTEKADEAGAAPEGEAQLPQDGPETRTGRDN